MNKLSKAVRVFEGTIGNNRYFFDVRTGKVLATASKKPGELSRIAKLRNYERVPRKAVRKELVRNLRKEWSKKRTKA